MIVTESRRTRGWSKESGGAMGYHDNPLMNKCIKSTMAVRAQPEDLDAIGEADDNLRNYIIANIHDDNTMSDILDALQLWEDFHNK